MSLPAGYGRGVDRQDARTKKGGPEGPPRIQRI